jgi:hypothetical protein
MKTALARGVFLAASVIFLEPALSAQTFGNLYVGYSFLSNDVHIQKQIGESGTPTATGRGNLNGWNISGEVKVFRWIGVVADFDAAMARRRRQVLTRYFLSHQRTSIQLSIPTCSVHGFQWRSAG